MNQVFADLFGYPLEDGPYSIPLPWWPSTDEDHAMLRSIVADAQQDPNREVVEAEFVLRNKNREEVTVLRRGAAIHHPTLGTTHVCVYREISAEKDAQQRRAAAADLAHSFAAVEDLGDLIRIVEHGLGLLFDGESTVMVADGEARYWFRAVEYEDEGSLPLESLVGLEGQADGAPFSLRSGILLTPPTAEVECRIWVKFTRPRRTTVDQIISADLLAAGFAAAANRIDAASKASSRESHLRQAIDSHRLIGQATGILVERHHETPAAAFERLRQGSQKRNQKLRELAALVIETGQEPEEL